MVLTDEVKTDSYEPLTFEDLNAAVQNAQYENKGGQSINITSVRTNVNFGGTMTNAMLARKSNGSIGATKLLKVMVGDKVNIFGKSYYFQNNTGGSSVNASIPVSDLVSNLLGTPTGVTAGKAVAADLTGNSVIAGALSGFISNPEREDAGNPQKPKAAINWLLLDENFRYVAGNFSAVGAANTVKDHYSDAALQHIPVTKNGYLYVYVSNQSPVNVFFDNLQVIHDKSALLEETHYYPFGLTMAGISSKAINKLENKFKFNDGTELASKEFSDGSGLDLYETEFRSYDPQIGRFHQMDLLMEFYEGWSPYTFALNNPILLNDPLGLASDTTTLPEVIVTPRGPDPMSPICLSCQLPKPDPTIIAGAYPLPSTTLTPIPGGAKPPLTIIEPVDIPDVKPLSVLGATSILTAIFTLIPNHPDHWNEGSYPNLFKPSPYAFPGHGNDDRNYNPHIVYQFTFTPSDDKTPVIKFGISDVWSNGFDRPENQLAGLKAKFGNSVKMSIVTRTMNRVHAKFIERLLVSRHVEKWNAMPRNQISPKPFANFKDFDLKFLF